MARMLFQKKGAPPAPMGPPGQSAGPSHSGPGLVISIGHGKADPGDAGLQADPGNAADQGTDGTAPCLCPKCGCVFDPSTGDILNAGEYGDDQAQQGDQSDQGPPAKDSGADSGDSSDESGQ